jgi:signal transduction histidine kinase
LPEATAHRIKVKVKSPKETYFTLIRIGFAVAIAFLVSQFRFDYVEALFFDARVRLKPVSPTSKQIELIAVDPFTVEQLGRVPNAADHVKLLKELKSVGAKSIVYLISPNEIVGAFEDLQEMAQTMGTLSSFYVAVPDMALKGEEDVFKLLPPFEKLHVYSAPKPVDRNIFAGDDVTRRMITSYQDRQTLYPIVAREFRSEAGDETKLRGVFDYLQTKQLYIDFKPARTYPATSFQKALTPSGQDLQKFRDKIVIIGRDIQTTAKDYARTPFSRDIVAMTVLELNANMLDTLILNRAPVRSPEWIDFLFTALISILTVHVVLLLKPTHGLVILGSTIVGYFVFSLLLFWLGGVWIGVAQPFIAIFICYYFFIPYRLIIENRRSWEYLQKNRLLTQVEELKTNFLSMMSHDLKTPIARIQGMTEVVLNDPTPLSSLQNEALANVQKSSQELLEFVSSILNLGRIESKEIQLAMKSKDPNSLLEEILTKCDHLAKHKNIQVVAELEPLFSVRMDVDLIRQVFTNLIENAIKYSPENSRILVTSEESNESVVIQVADQGMGIPEDELPHIFDKFYRSKNAKSSLIKGSGLGLYLAKYFVELHNGTISVDSRPGVGSTFTVTLSAQSPKGDKDVASTSSRR